jgi:hypothetical protein
MALHNDIFREQIWGWFCNDIESCFKVAQDLQARGELRGRLNFPAALTIFAVIELVAGYYAGKRPRHGDIAKFISRYLGKHYAKLADERVAEKWYEVFRHGLSHQWSPKCGGVSMDFAQPDVFAFAQSGTEEVLTLFVPALFCFTRAAMRDYEADLNSSVVLRSNFSKRYEELVSRDRGAMQALRGMCRSRQSPQHG